jgi:hypothetical protein
VVSEIRERLRGRSSAAYLFGRLPETGDLHHDRERDVWFIEAWAFPDPTPDNPVRYMELTRDEAAAWLDSHGYELPDSLVPSLRRDGIVWRILDTNATADRPATPKNDSAPRNPSVKSRKAGEDPPSPPPLVDERALVAALRTAKPRSKPRQARLVEYMIGKDSAGYEAIAKAVHDQPKTSDDAIESNARATSDSAATLGYRVRYDPRCAHVYKVILAE